MAAAKEIHQEGDIQACTKRGGCQFHKVYHDGHWVCGGNCCQNPMSDGIAARMPSPAPTQPSAM